MAVSRVARCSLVVAAFAACKAAGVSDTARVADIDIDPEAVTVAIGAIAPLTAELRDDGGNPVTQTVFWSSSDTSVARVSSSGVVTGRALGDATIAATVQGLSATSRVTVSPRAVSSVRITPNSDAIRVGATTRLVAQTFDASGEELTGRSVIWSSSNTNAASVDATGLVTGIAPGAVTITATSEGRSGTAAVTVSLRPVVTVSVSPDSDTLLVGTSSELTAIALDENGEPLSRAVTWSSSTNAVATVNSSGLVTAVSPGTATITATVDGKTGAAEIVVLERPVHSVTVVPNNSTIAEGETQPLTATPADAQGNPLDRKVTWQTSNNLVATVDENGVVTGVSPGDVTITAISEGKSGTATVRVTPMPVAHVEVSPANPSILTQNTVALEAAAFGANGKLLTGREVKWTSGAPGIASVGLNGVVTGETPGSAIIVATVEGVSGSTNVTVKRRVVASVTIEPANPTLVLLGSRQLSVIVRDEDGVVLNDRTVQWSSSNEAVAFVTGGGLVIGLFKGTATITATVEGVQGITTVTVQ